MIALDLISPGVIQLTRLGGVHAACLSKGYKPEGAVELWLCQCAVVACYEAPYLRHIRRIHCHDRTESCPFMWAGIRCAVHANNMASLIAKQQEQAFWEQMHAKLYWKAHGG